MSLNEESIKSGVLQFAKLISALTDNKDVKRAVEGPVKEEVYVEKVEDESNDISFTYSPADFVDKVIEISVKVTDLNTEEITKKSKIIINTDIDENSFNQHVTLKTDGETSAGRAVAIIISELAKSSIDIVLSNITPTGLED